jgi:replicative DNA helicase
MPDGTGNLPGDITAFGNPARTPPSNRLAEAALLAALMADNKEFALVDGLEPKHFFERLYQDIFRAALHLWKSGQVANVITVKAAIEHSCGLTAAELQSCLADLIAAQIGVGEAASYATVLRETWLRRVAIEELTGVLD